MVTEIAIEAGGDILVIAYQAQRLLTKHSPNAASLPILHTRKQKVGGSMQLHQLATIVFLASACFVGQVSATEDPCLELFDECAASETNNCANDHICQYKSNGPSAQRGWRCREPPNNMNNIDLGVDYYEGTCADIEFNANGEEVCQATWQGNKYNPITTCSNPNEECLIEQDADTNGFVGTGVCKATECVGGGQGQNSQEKGAGTYRVTICHRTCSKTNPWVRITIDEDAWFGQGCGHSREHNVTEDCNHNEAERIEHWGSPDPVDYLLKAHGYKKELNQWGQTDHDYWADWEPACPYVRSTKLNGQPCCDWAKGNCCGPRPDELVEVFPPVCGNGMIEGYGEGMEECEPELATPDGATMECSDDCKIPVCGNGVVDAPYEECDEGAAMPSATCVNCQTCSCGNGIVEGMEECDEGDAMPSATCVNCQTCSCGNGIVEGIEECDDGPEGSETCSTDCKTIVPTVTEAGTTTAPPVCGNGVVEPPDEECDSGVPMGTATCSADCKTISCGNGILEGNEECDEGAAMPSATCVDCQTISCGNGILEGNEECDEGAAMPSATCVDCQTVSCGNGILEGNEECDEGAAMPSATCVDCQTVSCGNGILEGNEECDEGAAMPSATCVDCQTVSCGNGILEGNEECDEGAAMPSATCVDCQTISCGNGILEGNEECDEGAAMPSATCVDCQTVSCGNGILEGNEECDEGAAMPSATCVDCQTVSCGNGILEGNEECDEGAAMPSATCVDCQTIACGNGILEGNEECDEGAAMPSATCVDCQTVSCGNGVLEGNEECDEGAAMPSATCVDCQTVSCGNGVLEGNEECDEGAAMPSATCVDCQTVSCGNGILEGNEECDEGAAMPSATCVDCQTISCGNGILEGNEECDEGAAMPSATCVDCQTVTTTVTEAGTTTTAPPVCGNGVVEPPDEECDSGEPMGTATCSADCKTISCGNGIVEGMEECDDGPMGSATCTPDCKTASCGDGEVNEPYEECDDGPMGSETCGPDCKFLPPPTTVTEVGTTTTGGDGSCPMSGIQLYSVNSERVSSGDFGSFGSEDNLPLEVITYAPDAKSVEVKVCVDNSNYYLSGLVDHNFECQGSANPGSGPVCDTMVLDCTAHNKVAIIDLFVVSPPPATDDAIATIPECCHAPEPVAVQYTFTALCYCPPTAAARQRSLRGIRI